MRRLLPLIAGAIALHTAAVAHAQSWPDALPVFPLAIAEDGETLVDQAGVPLLLVGDAAWSLMVQLTDAELDAYLADRRARGFNTLLTQITESGEFGGPANTNGDAPFDPLGDFTQPVEAYWARVDTILEKTLQQGFLVVIVPKYLGFGCGNQGWAPLMSSASVADHAAFGDFLAARYGHLTNLLWTHGGDASAVACDLVDEVNAIANRLEASSPGGLQSAHCSRFNSGIDCFDEPWLDVNSVYSSCERTPADVKRAWETQGGRPQYYIEGAYENEGAADTCLISQLYWPVLGGIEGSIFGNNPIWRFDSGWPGELSSAGASYVEWYARLFKSRPWAELIPDYAHTVVTSGFGSIDAGSYVGAATTSDGATLIAYSPESQNTLTVDLTKLSGETVQAWRYDPADGSTTDLGVHPTTGSVQFPLAGPAVLVVDDTASGFGVPGSEIFYVPEPGRLHGTVIALGVVGLVVWSRRRAPAAAVCSASPLSGD